MVSVERIQKYLNGSDKIENSTPGDTIRFENASFAWPTDGKVDNQTGRFVLHNVNVSFPPGDLSVITGDTGSGMLKILGLNARGIFILPPSWTFENASFPPKHIPFRPI